MAEIAGLALGAAGLATVFSGCIDAFDHVRVARTQDSALRILSTKLENQKVRFIIWGQSLGLDSAEGYNPQLDLPIRRDSIRRTMTLVYDLFMEGECLQQRYGLRKEPVQMPNAVVVFDSTVDQSAWKDFFRKMRAKIKKQRKQQQKKQQTQQQQAQLKPVESQGSVLRWVIVDRNDFTALVTNLRELIDDLESMCKFADVHEYRRMRVTYEIESMGDTESLNLIRAASEDDDDDAMSIAASNRLDELEYYSTQEFGYPWARQKQRPESNAYLVSYDPQPNPEEEAPRFYTPPSSVLQPHPRSRSRHRSKSPHDAVDDGAYWVPQASSPEAGRLYYYNTKYGTEKLQSDAPTSPLPQPLHTSRGRDGGTHQLNSLEIVYGGFEHDSATNHSPSDENRDLRRLDILTEERITQYDDDYAPPVVDSGYTGELPPTSKTSQETRINSPMVSKKAKIPRHPENSPSGGASSDTVRAPLRTSLGADQPSRKATARPARFSGGAPNPVEAESYQQIIDHVRERRSHRRKPRDRFTSILESDGEDDSSVDQMQLPSHADKPVDVGPHADESAEEKPSEETTSPNKGDTE